MANPTIEIHLFRGEKPRDNGGKKSVAVKVKDKKVEKVERLEKSESERERA